MTYNGYDEAIAELHDELRAIPSLFQDIEISDLGFRLASNELIKYCSRRIYIDSDLLTKYCQYVAGLLDIPYDPRVKRDICFIRHFQVIEMTRERILYLYNKHNKPSTTVDGSA
jgi:hypothetical protein